MTANRVSVNSDSLFKTDSQLLFYIVMKIDYISTIMKGSTYWKWLERVFRAYNKIFQKLSWLVMKMKLDNYQHIKMTLLTSLMILGSEWLHATVTSSYQLHTYMQLRIHAMQVLKPAFLVIWGIEKNRSRITTIVFDFLWFIRQYNYN